MDMYETFIFLPRRAYTNHKLIWLKMAYVINVAGIKFYEDSPIKAFGLYISFHIKDKHMDGYAAELEEVFNKKAAIVHKESGRIILNIGKVVAVTPSKVILHNGWWVFVTKTVIGIDNIIHTFKV